MSKADMRPNRGTDYERPSVDKPLVPHEWTEYRCRRCGEHCINRAEGEPSERELCLDCHAVGTAEDRTPSTTADDERSEGGDATPPSPLRSVRTSLATVAGRLGIK